MDSTTQPLLRKCAELFITKLPKPVSTLQKKAPLSGGF